MNEEKKQKIKKDTIRYMHLLEDAGFLIGVPGILVSSVINFDGSPITGFVTGVYFAFLFAIVIMILAIKMAKFDLKAGLKINIPPLLSLLYLGLMSNFIAGGVNSFIELATNHLDEMSVIEIHTTFQIMLLYMAAIIGLIFLWTKIGDIDKAYILEDNGGKRTAFPD